QARCSSKSFTEWPARASCSPHMEPDGPPPTIAISAIGFLADLSRFPFPSAKALGDRENRQGESSEEYSTEDCSDGRGLCPETNQVAGKTLQKRKHDKVGGKKS